MSKESAKSKQEVNKLHVVLGLIFWLAIGISIATCYHPKNHNVEPTPIPNLTPNAIGVTSPAFFS